MSTLLKAVSFLTRLPVRPGAEAGAADVARAAGWFPLVGVALGSVYCLAAALLKAHLPTGVIAALLVLLDALATGALHFDGLADTADGFGGGREADDVLRIMHDHSIGSYGGTALVVCVAVKVMAYAALLATGNWIAAIILAPALGRWSALLLTAAYRYAGQGPHVTDGMGARALALGTVITVGALGCVRSGRGMVAAGAVLIATACFGWYCRRRIGGITGDTLGANVQICECTTLLVFLWAR